MCLKVQIQMCMIELSISVRRCFCICFFRSAVICAMTLATFSPPNSLGRKTSQIAGTDIYMIIEKCYEYALLLEHTEPLFSANNCVILHLFNWLIGEKNVRMSLLMFYVLIALINHSPIRGHTLDDTTTSMFILYHTCNLTGAGASAPACELRIHENSRPRPPSWLCCARLRV